MLKRISVNRLTVGMHVSLREIPWFNHPFLLSHFEIRRQSELQDILSLGRETILYDPVKSKSKPLPEDQDIPIAATHKKNVSGMSYLKAKKATELRERRTRFQAVERTFIETLDTTKWIFEGIKRQDEDSCYDAKRMAKDISDKFLGEVGLAVQHINLTAADTGQQFHSLNVTTLSLMLAKEMELGEEDLAIIGLGGLLHDVGKLLLPKEVLIKNKLNKVEHAKLQSHSMLGVKMLSKLPGIHPEVMKIVYQHHEQCNGKGYPKGIDGSSMSELSKLVAIADAYDRLINPRERTMGLAPHKALSFMYKRKEAFDQSGLECFIKMLGVYPPGTVCRFTSGDIGIVVGVNPKNPLYPEILLYDPNIPKYEAIIYQLGRDIDLEIDTTLSSKEIDLEVKGYLDSRSVVQYLPNT